MNIDLQSIFDALPGLFLAVAPDSPRFTILAATDAYLHATKTQRSKIIGQPLFDVFPDNPDAPEVTATRNIRESLERAIQQRVPDTMAVQRHDIRRSIAEGEGFEERYWSPINTPVLDKTDQVAYLIHHVEDVTENERLKQKGDEQQALTNNLLRDITERKRDEEVLRQQSEMALRLSELEFRALAEAMPQIVWATLPDGRNIYFNQQWVDYTGMTMEESYGHGWNTPFHPEDKQRAWEAWQRATQHNERYSLECRLRRADGVYRWWLIRGEPMRDENGEIKKWFGTCTNIEELKRSEAMLHEAKNLLEQRVDERTKALKESEEQFRVLIQNLQSAVALVNERGAFTIVNQAFLRIFELNKDSNIKNVNDHDWSQWQVFDEHGALLGLEEHPVRKAALEGRPVRDQLVAVKAPGNPNLKWLLVSAEPILDSQSHIYRLICTYHDITERKLVEQALKESDKQFRALADSIPNLAWWANGDGYITWYNQRWYEYTGTTPAQMEGWGWQTVHDPVELPKVLECWRASIATGEPFEMTFPLRGADGVFRSFLTRIIPLKDSAGRVQQWFGTNTDVSELKQAEQALKKLNEELESRVLERTQDLAVIIEKLQFEMADREKAEKNVQRLNRLHKVLSATNHAIVRTKDRESLFSEFCRIAVEIGSFKLAWVGLVNDASSELKVVASCGATAYLEDIRITVNEEEPTGLGPTGISIREGSYYICNDFLTAEITRPWHEKGRAHGIRASASIALKQEGRVIGTLTLYADQKDFFDQQHVKLLQQMAADISFALDMIVRETYRQEAEQALNEETAERRRVEEEIRALNVNLEQRVAERTTELRHEITERERAEKQLKASLAEKEVMLREIHHRVKNNLQVISSLVSLQVDNLIDDRVREELNDVRDRVRSMAMIHEKLYLTNDLAQLNFADYATSLLRSLWRSHSTLANKVRLNLAVVPVALSIEAAVPCGLILNELAGNALKHAFPNDSGGEVTVGLEHDTTTSAICLWVRDNGVGLPSGLDWRRSPSLGLRLVQILTGQLRGTVETGTGPGAEFQVTFPLNAQS